MPVNETVHIERHPDLSDVEGPEDAPIIIKAKCHTPEDHENDKFQKPPEWESFNEMVKVLKEAVWRLKWRERASQCGICRGSP
jgi:hypothetical protein